ncbi:MAG TPA: HlyD family efflux transporter periplasmic adaptor subunit [Bacteroidetes bacterium]|nr:HlyD family efflux transporter periplasmic adaptor subunit [Bacteroidota bacterium]
MKIIKTTFFAILFLGFFSCKKTENTSDAYGNFEATETIVSAEANGRLLFLNVEEGQTLKAGELVALVDTSQLHLQKLQLLATIKTLPKKLRDASPDIAVLEDQKKNLVRERDRIKKLLADKAATPKQLDDMNGQIKVLEQRIKAAKSQTQTVNRGILAEQAPLQAQVAAIEDRLRKSYVRNPISGTVLTKLAEPSEVVGFGAPLYKIADLGHLQLRAYASAVQMQNVAIGQQVKVLLDAGEDAYRELPGEVTWISSESEFTPKTIQTKEERVNLVYAFKVRVENDGKLKIGMPAEVVF